MSSNQPLKVGMVGGGGGAFIANPPQKAIHFDGTRKVHSVALHPDAKIAMDAANSWPYPVKGYGSYEEMIAVQKDLPEEDRLDYILIVTPNFVHFDPAYKALEAGIPVMCEKPLTVNLEEADKLVAKTKERNIPFAVAHTYVGHWTSWFSRFIVQSRSTYSALAPLITKTISGKTHNRRVCHAPVIGCDYFSIGCDDLTCKRGAKCNFATHLH